MLGRSGSRISELYAANRGGQFTDGLMDLARRRKLGGNCQSFYLEDRKRQQSKLSTRLSKDGLLASPLSISISQIKTWSQERQLNPYS